MCNKYLLLVLVFLITGNTLLSQNIKIDKFYTDPFDISASTNTRKDLNGKNCALLKIQFVGNITDIEGNVIGEPIKQSNEMWIYLSPGTRFIKIKAEKHNPILIQFNAYNIKQVESNQTYILILDSDLPADILLSSGIQYAPMMSEKDALFPSWIENVNNNGYWLGISPPSINRIQARRMALTNALLSYLFATGKARIKSYIEENFRESEEKNTREYMFMETTTALLKHFRTDIINEYYNHRGEYIIACNIHEDDSSEDSLCIQKRITCINELTEINSKITLHTESESLSILFNHNEDTQISSFYFEDDKNSIYPTSHQATDYPSLSFMPNHDRKEDFFNTEINNSLGFTQFEILNMLPLIADSIKVTTLSIIDKKEIGNKLYTDISEKANFTGNGKSVPVKLIPENLYKDKLRYQVYQSGPLQHKDSIVSFPGYLPIIKEPLLLSKEISFYNAIKNLTRTYTQNILNSYSAEDILSDISSTLLPYLITDFCIDWCFNTNKRNEATMPPFIKILYNQSSIKEVKK